MFFLWLSILALFAGVLTLPLARKHTWFLAMADGFVLFGVGGIILLHVLPHSIEAGGWLAILAAAVGAALPVILERVERHGLNNDGIHQAMAWLAIAGLTLHVFSDGIALAMPAAHPHSQEEWHVLAIGVVLHRFPVGVGLAWVLLPRWGLMKTLLLGLGVAAATTSGFYLGGSIGEIAHWSELAVFQALVAGSLLHIVLGHGPKDIEIRSWPSRPMSAVGALAAMVCLSMVDSIHGQDPEPSHATDAATAIDVATTIDVATSVGRVFLDLTWKSAPALLLFFLVAGLIRAIRPPIPFRSQQQNAQPRSIVGGLVLGMSGSSCPAERVSGFHELQRTGTPGAVSMAFLVAAGALGLDGLFLSVPLLGLHMALVRLLATAMLAVGMGLLISRWPMPASRAPAVRKNPILRTEGTILERVAAGLRHSLLELTDHDLPWLIAGLAMASFLQTLLPPGLLARIPDIAQAPLAALTSLAFPMSSACATPIAAALTSGGLSGGAGIAFLLSGPAIYATVLSSFGRPMSRSSVVTVCALMLLTACVIGWAIDGWAIDGWAMGRMVPVTGEISDFFPATVHHVSTALVGVLALFSLFRCGPRALLAEVVPTYISFDRRAIHPRCAFSEPSFKGEESRLAL